MAMNREFVQKYGTSGSAINRAIREEIPGMDGIMDALERLSVVRQHATGERYKLLVRIEDAYVRARDAAKQLIRLKYAADDEQQERGASWDNV